MLPYCIRVIGTNTGAADDETRAWMATDWLVRVQTPVWLDLAGLSDHARALRELPALTTAKIAVGTRSVLDAAWTAARTAAGDAVMAASGDATMAAAMDALAPTVATLQASAFDLLDRMIAVGQTAEPALVEDRVAEYAAACVVG